MKKRDVNRTAGRAQNNLIFMGTEKIGIKNDLPPDNWNVLGTDNVGTFHFLRNGNVFNMDIKTMIDTGPKSFTKFRKCLLRNRLLSKAVDFIVEKKVASDIANETNGIVRLLGSALIKLRRSELEAS